MTSAQSGRQWRLRRNVATGLVIAFALYSSNRVFMHQLREYRRAKQDDEVTRYERRFEALRPRLPDHGLVGMIRTPPAAGRGNIDPLYTAQYSLCPVVLVRQTDQPWVIANLDAVDDPPSPAMDPGLQLVEDLGDGILLYRRVP